MQRIQALQHLRAIAALAVVAYHVLEATRVRFPVGAAGVDVFFVISGFIIGLLIAAPRVNLPQFYWRRAVRVLPPYWLATFALIAVTLVTAGNWAETHFSLDHVWRSLALIPGNAEGGFPQPMLEQGWTLYYEMFFYLLAGVALLAPARWRSVALLALVAAPILAGILISLPAPAWRVYTRPLMVEFAFGVMLASVWRSGFSAPAWVGWVLLAASVAGFGLEQTFDWRASEARWLVWGAPAALGVSGALVLERAGKTPKAPWLSKLGDASYSLYLTHTIAFAGVTIVLGQLGVRVNDIPPLLFTPLKVAAAIGVGLMAYEWFERPMLKALRDPPRLSWAKRSIPPKASKGAKVSKG